MHTITEFKEFISACAGNTMVELVVGGVVMPAPKLAMVEVDGRETVRIISDAPWPKPEDEPAPKKRKATEPA